MPTQEERVKRAEERCAANMQRNMRLYELFTPQERSTLYNACRVAAARFKEDLAVLRENSSHARLIEQFERQEKDTLVLMELFE